MIRDRSFLQPLGLPRCFPHEETTELASTHIAWQAVHKGSPHTTLTLTPSPYNLALYANLRLLSLSSDFLWAVSNKSQHNDCIRVLPHTIPKSSSRDNVNYFTRLLKLNELSYPIFINSYFCWFSRLVRWQALVPMITVSLPLQL